MNGRSVLASRRILYCAGDSFSFHSCSRWLILMLTTTSHADHKSTLGAFHTSSLKANSPFLLSIAIAPVDANSAAFAGPLTLGIAAVRMAMFSSTFLRADTPPERLAARQTERDGQSPPAFHRLNNCAISQCSRLGRNRLTSMFLEWLHSSRMKQYF